MSNKVTTNLREMRRALALELPGPVYDDVADRINAAILHIDELEARLARCSEMGGPTYPLDPMKGTCDDR